MLQFPLSCNKGSFEVTILSQGKQLPLLYPSETLGRITYPTFVQPPKHADSPTVDVVPYSIVIRVDPMLIRRLKDAGMKQIRTASTSANGIRIPVGLAWMIHDIGHDSCITMDNTGRSPLVFKPTSMYIIDRMEFSLYCVDVDVHNKVTRSGYMTKIHVQTTSHEHAIKFRSKSSSFPILKHPRPLKVIPSWEDVDVEEDSIPDDHE